MLRACAYKLPRKACVPVSKVPFNRPTTTVYSTITAKGRSHYSWRLKALELLKFIQDKMAMSGIASPRTPSPELATIHSDGSLHNRKDRDIAIKADRLVDNMTPPPSSQNPRAIGRPAFPRYRSARQSSLASPPATLKTAPPITSVGLYGEVPSIESVHQMDEDNLRTLIIELLPALGEARVTAAHAKLQHSLLVIENEEAAKRAEVEHEATRREVQVLQEGGTTQRQGLSPQSPSGSMQSSLRLALAHCRELQAENATLAQQVRKSKKLIAHLHGENTELAERVRLFRQRIKANRDHLNEMQSSGAISLNGTPITEYNTPILKETPRTPATHRTVPDLNDTIGSQTPFDTLLFAGQILNGEATSVPATPSPTKPRKYNPMHIRGAHSLSSLPSTPELSQQLASHGNSNPRLDRVSHHSADQFVGQVCPGYHARDTHTSAIDTESWRDDRDSTISVSDNEGEVREENEIAGSPASQRASSMLRRSLDSFGPDAGRVQAPNSGKPIQAKLAAPTKKPLPGRNDALFKRPADDDVNDAQKMIKMAKVDGTEAERRSSVGLGIVR